MIKLVVWDVDALQPDATLVPSLDRHGILQSVINRDDPDAALERLRQAGLTEYFLCPQLGVDDKTAAVRSIADELNIKLESVLLADDDVHAAEAARALSSTAAAGTRLRRLVYAEELARRRSERQFVGSRDEFHASLETELTIARATKADLPRVMELVARTNQSAVTYQPHELEALLSSPFHECWLVSLQDRFGDCGQVGLILLATSDSAWTLELFQFSCRALPRAVDTIVLNALLHRARTARVRLRSYFRKTRRNEALWLAYRNAGFESRTSEANWYMLEHPLTNLQDLPPHTRLRGEWSDDV